MHETRGGGKIILQVRICVLCMYRDARSLALYLVALILVWKTETRLSIAPEVFEKDEIKKKADEENHEPDDLHLREE